MKPAGVVPLSSNGNEPAATPPLFSINGTSKARSTNGASRFGDQYVEWDDPATIAAIEETLSQFGEVIRLEATEDFPAALRASRPDIVFNIAEALGGAVRESYVPTF